MIHAQVAASSDWSRFNPINANNDRLFDCTMDFAFAFSGANYLFAKIRRK